MKRPRSSDSLTGDANGAFLEDEMACEGEEELSTQVGMGACGSMSSCEKKRRLSVEQVKALEKNFEVENKLEPERKLKLAMELGLQPRQVAVWFQNRRARWKTKQLERDYTVLKSNYDSLKLSYDTLCSDKDALLVQIKELKLKLGLVKEEPSAPEELPGDRENKVVEKEREAEEGDPPELIYKDGSSDSDSSAILNDENSPNHLAISSSSAILSEHYQLHEEQNKGLFMGFHYYPQQHLRPEEHGLLDGEEPCSTAFFSDEPPAMPWYYAEQWS